MERLEGWKLNKTTQLEARNGMKKDNG